MLDVIMPTMDDRRTPGGLRHIGVEYTLTASTLTPWARAANALLDSTTNDVLHIDDDVELLPGALDLVWKYYDQADIFGMSLLTPNDPRTGWAMQSAGHALLPGRNGAVALTNFNAFAASVPCLVAHAGASCLYIKRSVVQAGIRFMEGWDGVHHEDVPFCLSAWLAGFRVARLPSVAIHYADPIGAGKTRKGDDYWAREKINAEHLRRWMDEHEIARATADGRIPLGVWAMDGQPWTLEGSGADRVARTEGR